MYLVGNCHNQKSVTGILEKDYIWKYYRQLERKPSKKCGKWLCARTVYITTNSHWVSSIEQGFSQAFSFHPFGNFLNQVLVFLFYT